MPETFTIKQEMKFIEFLKAVYFQASKIKIVKRLFLFSVILGTVNSLLNLASPLKHEIVWYQLILQALVLPLFFVAFFFVFITLGVFLLIKFRANHFKNITYYFSHWGMEKTGNGMKFTTPWSKFIKFQESSNFIFLYITKNDAHIIQKRMFENNEEIQSFKQFISKHIISS
jgi:hypothetical protein